MSRQPVGANEIDAPSGDFVAVTPDDNNDLPGGPCRAIYVGTAGNLTVIGALNGSSVTFNNLPVGIHWLRVRRVLATGTAAGGIVALY